MQSMRNLLVAVLAIATATSSSIASPAVSESTTTSADGTRIYYRVAGTGPEVVLAPFALFHTTRLDALASDRRRIVTYDPRGRGKSQKVPPDKVSLDLLLADLDAVRNAVGAERVAIIGWSGGGMETFVYALRNPTRVIRLVQLAPVGPRLSPYSEAMMADRAKRTDQAAATKLAERRKVGEFAGRGADECRAEAAVDLPALLADPTRFAMLPDVCAYENEWPANLGAYFGGLFKSIEGFDWRGDLAKVTIPRLVVHGEKDNIPLAASEEWVRGQANARLVVIEAAGHFPHYEQPEKTLNAIRAFLDGGWPAEAKVLAP